MFRIGIDIVEVNRIEQAVARWGDRFLHRVFTAAEIEYCAGRAQSLAGRFAAKEAVSKALGTGWRDGLAFPDIEIINDELGKPQVFLHGKVKEIFDHQQIKQASISMSHTDEIAIAVAILEK